MPMLLGWQLLMPQGWGQRRWWRAAGRSQLAAVMGFWFGMLMDIEVMSAELPEPRTTTITLHNHYTSTINPQPNPSHPTKQLPTDNRTLATSCSRAGSGSAPPTPPLNPPTPHRLDSDRVSCRFMPSISSLSLAFSSCSAPSPMDCRSAERWAAAAAAVPAVARRPAAAGPRVSYSSWRTFWVLRCC